MIDGIATKTGVGRIIGRFQPRICRSPRKCHYIACYVVHSTAIVVVVCLCGLIVDLYVAEKYIRNILEINKA